MENRKDAKKNTPIDPHLDTPAEANREKHINFLEVEDESVSRPSNDQVDDFASERRKQWEKGIAEGKEAHDKSE
jgi:hypothetical protein